MPAAQSAYERSAEIRVPMAAEFPNDSNIVRDGAIAYEKLGDAMVAAGNLDAALAHRQRALEMFRNLLQVDPQNVHAQQSLAISHIHLADLLGLPGAPNLGRAAEAAENYRRAIALLDGINRTDARNASVARDLAEAQRKLAALTGAAAEN
jgi:tetratricopeptide (TPR) repeat protein